MRKLATIKKNVAILLLLVLTFLAIGPLTASAQAPSPEPQGLESIFISSAGCVAGGVLGSFVVELFNKGIEKLTGLLPDSIKKFFALTDEVPIHNQKDWTKQNVLDLIARCGARAILNDMTHKMIGAVRTSGRGNQLGQHDPSFVRDWRRFLSTAQYRGENIFRSMLGSTALCNNVLNLRTIFQADNQPSLPPSYKDRTRINNLDPFDRRANCTMPQGWTLQKYSNDFAGNGGWGALVRLAEPQNNYYGALLLSLGEVAAQRAHEENSDQTEGLAGLGLTSRRGSERTANCAAFASNGQCIIYKDILTPGSILQQSAAAVIGNELSWLTSIDEMEELMSNLTTLTLSRILNLSRPDMTQQEPFPREPYPGFVDDPDLDTSVIQPPPPVTECNNGEDDDGDGLIDYPADTDCGSASDTSEGSSGGGGICSDTGTTTARYEGQLDTAMDAVIANNPGGIADQPNTQTNAFTFFGYVITELNGMGLQGSFNVLNGNGNPNSGDLIGVWTNGDTLMDRYDAITGIGSGEVIRTATQSIFTGQIPISSCTSGSPIPIPPSGTTYTVSFQTTNGTYVAAEGGGGSYIDTEGTSIGSWETFTLYDINQGTLTSGDQVYIQVVNDQFWRAEGGGGSTMDATPTSEGVWETFVIEDISGGGVSNGDQVSLRTWNGNNYVAAEGGGGPNLRLDAEGTSVGAWETFTIIVQ